MSFFVRATRFPTMLFALSTVFAINLTAQSEAPSAPPANVRQSVTPLSFEMPKSRNPLNAYMPDSVPEPVLANSARIDRMVRDGKLYLSLPYTGQ